MLQRSVTGGAATGAEEATAGGSFTAEGTPEATGASTGWGEPQPANATTTTANDRGSMGAWYAGLLYDGSERIMKKHSWAIGVTCGCALLATAVPCRAGELVLDDFEGASSPAPWTFTNGPEFPGATGALSSVPGHSGKGARLSYDFTAGGNYVSAEFKPASPISAAAIGLWVRSPPGIHVVVRAVDETGQTLQFRGSRPLYATDPASWYRQVVAIGTSTEHWGGADDGTFHGKLAAVSILAADPLMKDEPGAVDFDDVVAMDSLEFDLEQAASSRVAAPTTLPRLRDMLGVNIHFTHDDQALDLAKLAGMGWVRMDLFWSSVETKSGVYDFSPFDDLVAALEAREMKAHFILCYANVLHSDGPDYAPQSAATVQAFGDYAEAAAKHFAGHGVQYEVWNEANIPQFWVPAPDAVKYADLAREAIQRVHLGDPTARVSTTGTAGFDFDFLKTCLANGCGDEADAIGVHPYRQGGPESAADDTLLMRTLVAKALPDSPPVWSTEWGYSSSWYGLGSIPPARKKQAVFAARETLVAWALGFPFHVYYDIRDDGTDPTDKEHNFGLLQNDYGYKQAFAAFRTLADVTAQRTLTGFVPAVPSTLHVVELSGPGDILYAIWSSEPDAESLVRLPAGAQVVDFVGNAVETPAQMLTVREADGPSYVVVANIGPQDSGTDADAQSADVPTGDAPAGDAPHADGMAGDGAIAEAGAQAPTGADDGGCSCRVGPKRTRLPVGAWWVLLAWLGCRKRRQA